MKDRVPVTVVIPAYNAEDFLAQAVKSVRDQTLPVAEIIVVDDGSSDRTSEIARDLGVVLLRQENRGVCAARNTGIRSATSEWIALLDQDDTWDSHKIECQWEAVRSHPQVGIVSCRMSWIENGVEEHLDDKDADEGITYLDRVGEHLPLRRTTDNPSSLMIRRDLLMSVGFFDESLRQNEDLECFLRLVKAAPLAIVERTLIQHRVHPRSRSMDALESGLSFTKLVDKLKAEPERYPDNAAVIYDEHLSRMLVPLGRALLEDGRSLEARDLFGRSLKRQFSGRAFGFWLLTFFGPRFFKCLLAIKRKLSPSVTHREPGEVY